MPYCRLGSSGVVFGAEGGMSASMLIIRVTGVDERVNFVMNDILARTSTEIHGPVSVNPASNCVSIEWTKDIDFVRTLTW